jgi:hypothetical protein
LLRVVIAPGQFRKKRQARHRHTEDKATLAEIIGTTRSQVSFFMNKFRKLGFVFYNTHLEVHSSLLNVALTRNPRFPGNPGTVFRKSTRSEQ